MANKKFDFSIIMDETSSIPSDVTSKIPIKPDKRGAKTIAILLFFGALAILFLGYQDYLHHNLDDIPQNQVDTLLETPNSQSEEQITPEQYQQFHDDARDSGGYIIRAIGLFICGIMLVIGSINLFRLRKSGPQIATLGGGIGLFSGIYGSNLIRIASDENLSGALLLTYEIFTYLCGICMFVCTAFSALPLINARARAALEQNPQVSLTHSHVEPTAECEE